MSLLTLKEYLESQSNYGRIDLPISYKGEISTYIKVPDEDTKGRTWYKVYWENSDCKYGAFMVSPNTKEWRNTTMSEFYGGAVVD